MCSFPQLAMPRGMSEFTSSEYTSPITRRRKAATRAARPIIKITKSTSMVSLLRSAKGESLGLNVLSAFQPFSSPPTSAWNSFWPWLHLIICLAAGCPGKRISNNNSYYTFSIFYSCVVKVITFFPFLLYDNRALSFFYFYISIVNHTHWVLGNILNRFLKGWYVFVPQAMRKLCRTAAVWHFHFLASKWRKC